MPQGIQLFGIYVHDQDEALAFYTEKLGFTVHTDAKNGDYRWLTVQYPGQPDLQLGLMKPQPPVVDAGTAADLLQAVAKGAMPPLVMTVTDAHATCAAMKAKGVEFTQEPIERYGAVDANFRDPSGNGWKIIQGR